MSLSYCPRCGKLFARGIRDVCNHCAQEIEKEYETCAKYLKENKGATIHELSEATEVSIKQITKFVREGRISSATSPNMQVPCEVCGLAIFEGNMCDSCRAKLQKEMKNIGPGSAPQADNPTTERKSGNSFQIRSRL